MYPCFSFPLAPFVSLSLFFLSSLPLCFLYLYILSDSITHISQIYKIFVLSLQGISESSTAHYCTRTHININYIFIDACLMSLSLSLTLLID